MKKNVANYIMNVLMKNVETTSTGRKGLIGAQKLPASLKKGK